MEQLSMQSKPIKYSFSNTGEVQSYLEQDDALYYYVRLVCQNA